VYQLTAIDVFSRLAVVAIVVGTPTGAMAARFIHQALGLYSRHGTKVRADAWLITCDRRRRNHGDCMRGRTPQEILDNHKRTKAA
jgi:hypothetical protein